MGEGCSPQDWESHWTMEGGGGGEEWGVVDGGHPVQAEEELEGV